MGIEHRCRWVRHRLPLVAGGELGVEERRQVERHLIGCLDCRDRLDASTSALTALRTFAEEAPMPADSPSLWPSLALQIRQSRHVASRPAWWELPLARPWLAFGLASGLGAILAVVLALPSAREAPRPNSTRVVDVPEVDPEVVEFSPGRDLAARPARPAGAPLRDAAAFDAPQTLQFGYDLDHGTPMAPGNRDPQRSY